MAGRQENPVANHCSEIPPHIDLPGVAPIPGRRACNRLSTMAHPHIVRHEVKAGISNRATGCPKED